jgi:catechol 2,3-dioxygenase-like lactoylglutathione lyase family enzyme
MSDATLDAYGVPAIGSPLYAATIGAEDLDASIRFYGGELGLDVVERRPIEGRAFELHWGLPVGATGECAVLADRELAVGRIVLIEFHAAERRRVRHVDGQRCFGFVNLNFYTDEIDGHTKRLEAAGARAWSAPVVHDMGVVGTPVEVMLDGPDSVIINLIELRAADPSARLLRTVRYIEENGGYNRCGSTAVATSQHCVRDHAQAMAFNIDVLGMSVRNDVVLSGESMEHFMRYPPGAKSRDTYLQGNHVFGKIAVNHPLNFTCDDLVPRAVAPHIGYLAQSFLVPDLQTSLAAARAHRAVEFSEPVEYDAPGLGRVMTSLVRNPGSGALHELIQRA